MARKKARRKNDQYFTPAWAVHPFLEAVAEYANRPGDIVLEPSVGHGAVLSQIAASRPAARLVGVDIDGNCLAHAVKACPGMVPVHEDYLGLSWPEAAGRPELIPGNPPYVLATQFVRKLLREVSPTGAIGLLLRLCWMETPERRELLDANPCEVIVLERRPSFTGDGNTDGQAYAWFVWHPRGDSRNGKWRCAPCNA